MEKTVETPVVYWGYIGDSGKEMETPGVMRSLRQHSATLMSIGSPGDVLDRQMPYMSYSLNSLKGGI